MNFIELITRAKDESGSELQIVEMYKPLLIKESIHQGIFDEDLFQELVLVLMRCIRTFNI